MAPKLDAELKPVITLGTGIETIPAGSTAVRRMIEKYQPLMGLHGHIHEARGDAKIGRTVCYSPEGDKEPTFRLGIDGADSSEGTMCHLPSKSGLRTLIAHS